MARERNRKRAEGFMPLNMTIWETDMMKFRIFGIAGAAVLALALNGCGSSSAPMEEEMEEEVVVPVPEPTPQEMAQNALTMAKMVLAALPMDATREARLVAEQAVLTAAQALLMMYQANPDSTAAMVMMAQSEVNAAMMAVGATMAMIENPPADEQLAAARMALAGLAADASAEDRAAAVAAVVAALMLEGNADAETTTMEDLYLAKADLAALPEGASNQDLLAAQQGVVTAANAVVLELEEGDAPHSQVVAAKMVLSDAEAAADATQKAITDVAKKTARSNPLNLTGAAIQKAVGAVHGELTATGATVADEWTEQDPTNATDFVKYGITSGAIYSYGVSNQKISVTPVGAAVETDTTPGNTVLDLPAFAVSKTKDAPSAGTGWMGSTHEREYKRAGGGTLTGADDVVVMDMVTTYTNQDPAGDEYYATYYSVEGKPELDLSATADADGALNLADGSSKLAKSSGFPSGVSQSFVYDDGAGNKPAATGDDVLLGTFNGVSGKFSCTDGTCLASTNAAGALSLNSGAGNWVFTPDGDPEKIVVMGVIEDVDYLAFGYWVETTTDMVNDKTTYRVGVTQMRGGPATAIPATAIATTVTGNATYKGPAAGMFARRAYDPESGGDVETAGRFTADATLTADFDAADLSIDGTVTNFMHAGSAIDSDWTVTMSEGVITPTGGLFASDPAKQTVGDGSVWTGQFNGHYAADNTGTPVNETTLKPTGATGMFSNTFDNGAVLGAFGAEKQ